MNDRIKIKWLERQGLDPYELLPTWLYHHGEYHAVLMPRWKAGGGGPREVDVAAFKRAHDFERGLHQVYRRDVEPASNVIPYRPR